MLTAPSPDVSAPAPSAERRAQLVQRLQRVAVSSMACRLVTNPESGVMCREASSDVDTYCDRCALIAAWDSLRSDAERSTPPTPCAECERLKAAVTQAFVDGNDAVRAVLALVSIDADRPSPKRDMVLDGLWRLRAEKAEAALVAMRAQEAERHG